MAFDKFTPIRTQVEAAKAQAQTGGLPATNAALVELCTLVENLLNVLAATTTTPEQTRGGVTATSRNLKIDDS